MNCPDDDTLLAFLAQSLAAGPRAEILDHLADCADCRALVAEVARAGEGDGAGGGEQGAGPPDRYVLLSALGEGGMGVVQAAFDRQLDRKVALKFLRSAPGEDATGAQARLQREAQALARLTHPNVVTVHDVGLLDGEVFVAMELVEGTTLRAWLAGEPRPLRDVLAVLLQAGEGLAAAHAAGLVHRDFKPDNVLLGRDGRARVTDFGLARDVGAGDGEGTAPPRYGGLATLTRTGVRAGTPAYMAPEQRRGEPAGQGSDVYAYCVTLHEAATGVRPGQPVPARRRPPPWLDRAIARGLREAAGDRWPSMRALLDVLRRGPRVTAARAAIAASAAALLVASAAIARGGAPPAPVLCAPEPAVWAGVWDAPQRDAVQAAFRLAYPARADAAFAAMDGALTRLRDGAIAMRAQSCSATRLRRDQSESLLDLRSACLDQLRLRAAAAVEVLSRADRGVVESAVGAAADLPRVETCADARSLEAAEPLPHEAPRREAIQAARARLAEVDALLGAGKEKQALAIVEPALEALRPARYPPLEAQLLLARASALMEVARDATVVDRALHEAAQRAIEARDDVAAGQAWILLTWQARTRGDEGRRWADYAGAAIRRLGGDDFLEADRSACLGQIEMGAGRLDEAHALLERARELFRKTRGEDYWRIAGVDDALGNIASAAQRVDEALRLHRQSRALRERVFGSEHGATISSMFNEAADLLTLGRPADALSLLQEVEAILQRQGDVNTFVHQMFAAALRDLGDPAGALARDRLGVAGWDREAAPDDTFVTVPLTGEGRDLLALGRPAEAIAPLERALSLLHDAAPADRADTLFTLARALHASGRDRTRAVALAQQAGELLDEPARRYGGQLARDRSAIAEWLSARGARPSP